MMTLWPPAAWPPERTTARRRGGGGVVVVELGEEKIGWRWFFWSGLEVRLGKCLEIASRLPTVVTLASLGWRV
jgi:hypothetical protein